ncbi:MAG: non-homologous end-joining DNA ligase, partial [Actinomycetota bacterium]|nr:non-homologous end-joining DNA ligase [Actinomycetota bacterium]
PMLATAGPLPPAAEDDRWGYEFKWDGVRATIYVDGGRITIRSRNDRDVSVSYPELRALGEALGSRQVVLDGEIVAFDDSGRPSFGALQERMHVAKAAEARRLAAQVPATFLAFDLLHVDGRATTDLAYAERRALLESLALAGPSWQTPPSFAGGGEAVLTASKAQGLEGVVAKRLDSAYSPGRRSEAWLKVKNIRHQAVVVGGWKPGAGNRKGQIGSLLVGVQANAGLVFAGHVGTGFSQRALADLGRQLEPTRRATPPFDDEVPRAQAKDAVWVEPSLVGEVAFTEWTRDGRLRHPSWRGLRPDRVPADVVREP